jgi:isoleucyl-tRNA synthetase
MTPLALRAHASNLASTTMASQSQSFQRYGVWGDWENPYATLQPCYEAQQVRVFGEMVKKGYIYRGKKPVHWSPSSHTALAEAELEYPTTHVSTSVYVGFQVVKMSPALEVLHHVLQSGKEMKIAVWTTTPWTLPANQAVAVNPSMMYAIVSNPLVQNGSHFLVAKDLIPQFTTTMLKSDLVENKDDTLTFNVCGELSGWELVGTEYQHPIHKNQTQRVVVGGSYVTAESGTGLVHTAPGHGMDDFITGQRENLDLVSPVDDYGRFTEEAGEALFKKDVLKGGNEAVIDMLKESHSLLLVEPYPHKYPYDWRTGKPTITRTTEQWFASVEAFRDNVMEAIEGVQWVPAIGQKRISSMVMGRKDWCISRQRSWGVPIPVFYHEETKEVLMTGETIAHVEKVLREKGSDAWWSLEVADLLPEDLRHLASSYRKGTDTMDVWFDSGTSWAGVLKEREEANGISMFPADMYLEGSDQHRGWFQSSLLTSVAASGIAPYKSVLTHGFVLDEKGHKMSKSLGNVVDPYTIINGGKSKKAQPAYGADTLRLWVAGVDYTADVSIGDSIIKQTSDTYRKLRNTLRFLLGSISDFNPSTDSVPFDKLPSLDKFMLGKLTETFESVDRSYSTHQFYKASSQINHFAINQLSNFYLDISKDRLYISDPNADRRRSCQTVLHHVFEQFVLMMAPLVPHMAEDAYQNLPHLSHQGASIFEKGWLKDQATFKLHETQRWDFMVDLRSDVNQCIELARRAKHIGASQECEVCIYVGPDSVLGVEETMQHLLGMMNGEDAFIAQSQDSSFISSVDDLRFILLVSQVRIVQSMEALVSECPDYHLSPADVDSSKTGVSVGVRRAGGKKCNRCWYYSSTVVDNSATVIEDSENRKDLCSRCSHILSSVP